MRNCLRYDEYIPIKLPVTNSFTGWWVLKIFEMCIVASPLFYYLIDSCGTKGKFKKGVNKEIIYLSISWCTSLSQALRQWRRSKTLAGDGHARVSLPMSPGPNDKGHGTGLNMMTWVLNVNFLVCILILLNLYSHVVISWCYIDYIGNQIYRQSSLPYFYLLERCASDLSRFVCNSHSKDFRRNL